MIDYKSSVSSSTLLLINHGILSWYLGPESSLPEQWRGFVCVEVLRPSQPNGVMSSAVSLPNHTFTGQA